MAIMDRVRRVWNAFTSTEEATANDYTAGSVTYTQVSPSRTRHRFTSEKTIVESICTRISIDVSSIDIRHVLVDEENRYVQDVDSYLNTCFTLEPNMDQGPRAFRQNIALTMMDKGVAVVVPVDTIRDSSGNITEILSVRVGEVVGWYPSKVRVSLYNEKTAKFQEILLDKKEVAIVENPLFTVMNEPNSTLQRLIRKLNLLDSVDEAASSGKLDLIIQLPYVIKSEARKQQAEKRAQDIEFQLKGSKYGIAYTDGTEKITQLNRPVENNLLKQIEFLTELLYSQLGITAEVMNGTASEATMINYYTRTVEPLVVAVIEAMQRAFLGLSKVKQGERIEYYRDPFKLVPLSQIAEIADKFTRNEIFTGNDVRSFIGVRPSKDPKADELRNSNMPRSDTELEPESGI